MPKRTFECLFEQKFPAGAKGSKMTTEALGLVRTLLVLDPSRRHTAASALSSKCLLLHDSAEAMDSYFRVVHTPIPYATRHS